MNLSFLEASLGLKFKNQELLREALTHRSYLNETRQKKINHNERLEYLGDAVLELIVSQDLFHQFPQAPEGLLTNYRSSLVKTPTLAKIARKLKLGDFLLMSKGEEEGGGRENSGLLADTFEAVLGAIYLDQGMASVQQIIITQLLPLLPEIIKNKAFKDYKSLLQEKIQAQKKPSPVYRVLQTEGPDHARLFTIAVFSQKEILEKGQGRSKQQAEQEAARLALEKMGLKD